VLAHASMAPRCSFLPDHDEPPRGLRAGPTRPRAKVHTLDMALSVATWQSEELTHFAAETMTMCWDENILL